MAFPLYSRAVSAMWPTAAWEADRSRSLSYCESLKLHKLPSAALTERGGVEVEKGRQRRRSGGAGFQANANPSYCKLVASKRGSQSLKCEGNKSNKQSRVQVGSY